VQEPPVIPIPAFDLGLPPFEVLNFTMKFCNNPLQFIDLSGGSDPGCRGYAARDPARHARDQVQQTQILRV